MKNKKLEISDDMKENLLRMRELLADISLKDNDYAAIIGGELDNGSKGICTYCEEMCESSCRALCNEG